MNANAFHHFYEYHFSENRKIWDNCIASLSQEQFLIDTGYSSGSVRNQLVHIMSADNAWFSGLSGVDGLNTDNPDAFTDRNVLRSHWDAVEKNMRDYLAKLQDDMLLEKPFSEGEDKDLILWQVLLHVANHGTDHRAQLLRLLNDMDVKTESQDYIFYIYEHM
jgi:uncharacterized damage-inducible protein DinB